VHGHLRPAGPDGAGRETMPIIRLVIRSRSSVFPGKPSQQVLALTNLSGSYFPIRGIPYSIIVHVIAFLAIFVLPLLQSPLKLPAPREKIVMIDISDPEAMLYFPMFLDGDLYEESVENDAESRSREQSVPLPRSTEGLSYPGPQPILSDVPDPTTRIQTMDFAT